MKKMLLSLGLFALLMTGFFVFGTQHAAAATWCGVMANPVNPPPPFTGAADSNNTDANCITYGQDYTALNGLDNSGSSSDDLKVAFKAYLNAKSNSSWGYQRIGAAFIMDGLDGNTGTWSKRLDNPAVTLKMETFNSCRGSTWPNTAYDIDTNRVVKDPDCKVATPALVIRLSGVVKYAIKVDCGNPMGELLNLPTYTPSDWTLIGTSSVNPMSAVRRANVTFKHTVKNSGPSSATYTWTIQKSYVGAAWSTVSSSSVTTAKNASNPNGATNSITIPSGAVTGSTYCQRVQYTFATGPRTATANSVAACVKVLATLPPPAPTSFCPNLPGVNSAAISASLPTGEPTTYPNATTYITRTVTGSTITSARDANTGSGLPFNGSTNTVDFRPAVAAYPYDSQWANVSYTNTYNTAVYKWQVIGSHFDYNRVTKKWDILVKDYGWVLTGSSSGSISMVRTDGSASMGECYRRGFTVTSVDPGNVSLDNPEDPTQASAGGASATVDFDYNGGPTPKGGMRTPMKIQLNYSWQFDSGCSGNGSFTVTGGYGAGSASGFIPVSPSCPASAPPLKAGDRVCISYTVEPETGEMTSNGVPLNDSGSVDSSPICSSPVVDMPYAHFFGLDVSAGGSFANGDDKCLASSPPAYGIVAFVKGTGPLVRGSAVQFGALATGPINGFGSASLRTSLPTARDGLTFANAGALGNLGSKHCVPDYFSTKPATLTNSLTNPVNLTPMFSGLGDPATPKQYWYGAVGGRTAINGFSGANGINKGHRIAIYVTGDVYITEDIKFKQASSWLNPDDVPSFYLIVKGNIYISPNVAQLDGVYVAQGGTINTCAKNYGNFPSSELYDNCTKQLVVNGAFVAQKVNLYRTFASLRNSQGGESPLVSTGDCSINVSRGPRNGNYDCAAEVFNFSPETFLSKPALGSAPGSGITKYDFITSLSPVL